LESCKETSNIKVPLPLQTERKQTCSIFLQTTLITHRSSLRYLISIPLKPAVQMEYPFACSNLQLPTLQPHSQSFPIYPLQQLLSSLSSVVPIPKDAGCVAKMASSNCPELPSWPHKVIAEPSFPSALPTAWLKSH